jgi:lauroyl/myristoyl acyltransferase
LPQAARDSEQRFGQSHAKLFPFIGRKVRTPKGPGTLIQVFAARVTVVLDADLDKCSRFAPIEIEPVSWEYK